MSYKNVFSYAGSILCLLTCLVIPTVFADNIESVDTVDEKVSGGTEINIKNADLAAVIRIFSKKTKRNYILDEKVKGKVTIYLPGKVSEEESIKVLDSVLAMKGFAAVPISDNLWKILPSKEAKQSTIPTITDDSLVSTSIPSSALITRLLHLKYVNADEIQQLLSPLISSDGLLNAYSGTNSLILIDAEDNIARLMKIIEEVDTPFSDRDMTIIPIKHAVATDIAEKLKDILNEDSESKSDGKSIADSIRTRLKSSITQNGRKSSNTSPDSNSGISITARTKEPKIIADERTNAIIVVADQDTSLRIKALVSQLDSKVDLSSNRFYVYRCKHASAEDLADVLSGLSNGGSSSYSRNSNNFSNSNSNVASSGRRNSSSRTSSRLSSSSRNPSHSLSNNSSNQSPTSVSLGEDISITADPATNSLIINSGKDDYLKLKELLQELDIKRKQVLVEAILLEVTIDESMSLGTEFITSTGGADGGVLSQSSFGNNISQLFSDPTSMSNFSVAAASAGSLTLPQGIVIPTQSVLLTAAQNNSNVNVLSAPNILATDNEQAEIVVGQNVPFLASTSTSSENLNNTFNQIDRQDVGITLRMTPQINSESYVKLRIFTEVSNVIAQTAGSDLGPTTTVRTSETTVIAKDSQMVVIGGLMSDDVTQTDNGVPFLKDLPVLGSLFRTSLENTRKTNLVIFITPRIIQDQFDARDTTMAQRDEFKKKTEDYVLNYGHRELLETQEIDNVAEVSSHEVKDMGTILPPKANKKVADAKKKRVAFDTSKSNSFKLSVKPKISQVSVKKNNPKFTNSQFIILEPLEKLSSNLPFSISSSSNKLGIILPEHSSNVAKSFFKPGESYSYLNGKSKVSLKTIGIYSSEKEAAKAINDTGLTWHTLSPYEIMNLGESPWISVKKQG